MKLFYIAMVLFGGVIGFLSSRFAVNTYLNKKIDELV
jgi:hypothetical protein